MPRMTLGKARPVAPFLCVLLVYGGAAAVGAQTGPTRESAKGRQPAELDLQFQRDGMTGTCKADGENASLGVRRLPDGSSHSHISRGGGRVIVDVLRNKDSVEIAFPAVKIKIDLVTQTFIGLTEGDKEKLQNFLRSEDASLARKCITKLVQSKAQTDARKIIPAGLIIVGMLLGEEPPSAEGSQTTNAESLPLLLATNYGVRPRAATAKLSPACFSPAVGTKKLVYVRAIYQEGFGGPDCNGCCGVGCSSCSGYYTYECLAHDNCVSRYGQVSCVHLFAAAAASLLNAIEKGRGDWPPADNELLIM